MARFRKAFFIQLFLWTAAALLSGTTGGNKNKIPYSIQNAFVEDGYVTFELTNNSLQKIKFFYVMFSVVDAEGENCFKDGSSMVYRFDQEILPEESVAVNVSIEDSLSEEYDSPYEVGFCFLQQICFEDGTFWRDPWGKYSLR